MIKTKEEIMNLIKDKVGDDTSDDALKLVEDISDTFDDLETRANGDGVDWKKKYEENDAEWRGKYKERFFNGNSDDDKKIFEEDDDPPKKLTFESLFKEI